MYYTDPRNTGKIYTQTSIFQIFKLCEYIKYVNTYNDEKWQSYPEACDAHGLKTRNEEKASELVSKKCARCKTMNRPTSDLCASCGMTLDLETAVDAEKETKIVKILRESV